MIYHKYTVVNGKWDLGSDGDLAFSEVHYKDASPKNAIDIYLPRNGKGMHPAVFFVHGGGLFKSDKSHHLSNVLHCLKAGIAVVAVNYRLNDEAWFEEILSDVRDAFTFTYNHADKFHIDKNRLAVWGETHGAFLSDMIALNQNKTIVGETVPFRLKGVVSMYAPDLDSFYSDVLKRPNQAEEMNKFKIGKTFHCTLETMHETLSRYKLTDQVTPEAPAFMLVHGEKDNLIPHKATIDLADKLAEKEVSHILYFVKNGTHGIDFYDEEEYNMPIIHFLADILR